jgi:Ca2+-transporting ATPase
MSPVSTGLAPWWARAGDAVAAELATDVHQGLAPAQAAQRRAADGPNELPRAAGVSLLTLASAQFRSGVVWLLAGAAVVAGVLGETRDAVAVLAIIGINAVIGFVQEFRAERALAALRRMAAAQARVVRGGRMTAVIAADVVRGDLLLLEAGDVVAADARLVEAAALRIDEAALTGESEPADKSTALCPADAVLADRRNAVFFGTKVVHGAGRAIVVATGTATEAGRIAGLLGAAPSRRTPLHARLDDVARRLTWACLGIVGLVFVLGRQRGERLAELLLAAVSLAVAAVPEGLPAVVTVALAVGVQRMVRRNVLVRRLASVETLGGVHVICTDKTGTLTLGEMTVRRLLTMDTLYAVTGEGYAAQGAFVVDGAERHPSTDGALGVLLEAMAAASEASIEYRDGHPCALGDPVDAAMVAAAAKSGITSSALEARLPRLARLPFDAERRRMSVMRRRDDHVWLCVKGAPETVLARCASVRGGAGPVPFGDVERARMLEAVSVLAGDGLRVIAVAERVLDTVPAALDADAIEQRLVLLGLVGMHDPPRPAAREAVARCRRAGIRTVMVTGDHPATASAIARELGILGPGDRVVLGSDVARMSAGELAERIDRIAVFARVSPEDKLAIVKAWQARGLVVAMTGDGVNDAPALATAAVGVAMGLTGTEVSKGVADIVITDDDFSSIVAAVEEGRTVYENIAKTLAFLLAGNTAELMLMLGTSLAGWPLPLLPAHLLWINLVTDGLPALALATDAAEPGVLARPPRPAGAPLIDRARIIQILFTGGLTAGVAFAAFALHLGDDVNAARDAAFTVLVVGELLRGLGARSEQRVAWELDWTGNVRLLLVIGAGVALQIAIHHWPLFQGLLGLTPITLAQCVSWVALGTVPLLVIEGRKVLARRTGGQR